MSFPNLRRGVNSLESIGDVLRSHDVESNKGKAKLAEIKGDFRFEGVSFCYPGTSREVLSDINLEVKPGSTIAFVGESGFGQIQFNSSDYRFLPTHSRATVA